MTKTPTQADLCHYVAQVHVQAKAKRAERIATKTKAHKENRFSGLRRAAMDQAKFHRKFGG